MIITKMTVDGHEYFLDCEQDVDGAKCQAVEAVQHGGGLVDVLVAGHSAVSVMVSQTMAVTFEQITATEEAGPLTDSNDDDFWRWAELGL